MGYLDFVNIYKNVKKKNKIDNRGVDYSFIMFIILLL